MSLRRLTGLAIDTIEDAQTYYDQHSAKIDGAPQFGPEILPWMRYLDNARPGETWPALFSRISAEQDAARRGGDLFRAIYPEDISEAYKWFEADDAEQLKVDAALERAATLWSDVNDDPTVGEVFGALIDQAPIWARLPLEHQPDSAEWLWSRMRMVCGSAGYNNHAALATRLSSLYPLCPMSSDETKEQWLEHLQTAHKACGWPVQLGQLSWKDLRGMFAMVREDEYVQPQWHAVVALLHVLKHVRLSPDSKRLVTILHGGAVSIDWPRGGNVLASKHLGPLVLALKLPSDGAKRLVHPMTTSVRNVLTRLTSNVYLRQRPLAELPGLVLHGPWSSISPDPMAMDGFIQHGSRLAGVWLASNNKVEPANGQSSDIVGYAWNHDDAMTPERLDARAELQRIMPERYEAGFASDLFWRAFPNLVDPEGVDIDAVRALFDAPIVASLLRPEVPGLAFEFPIVAFLPHRPTLDESTNQGKSLAALTYARILAPTIRQVISGLDSSSAPDIRDQADQLRMHGTVAIDEFQMPKSKAHVFARSNLQLLCTGGRASAGKVLENSGGVSLRHSLVVNAKALDFNPDMTNRTLPFYLDDLTDEHRANAQTLADLQSGRLALLARLQTLALVIDERIVDRLAAVEHVSTSAGLRFGVHRAIARILYEVRTGGPDSGQVDAAAAGARARFTEHQTAADDNGVLSSLDEGKVLRVRLSSLLGDLAESEMEALAGHVKFHGAGGWAPVVTLLNGRAVVSGQAGKPLCDAVGAILGLKLRMANRAVVLAVEREIRQSIQPDAKLRIGSSSWYLHRRDTDEAMLVKLEKKA